MQTFALADPAADLALAAPLPSLDIETQVRQCGGELLDAARQQRAGWLSAQYWNDQLVAWAMREPSFKLALFRFIDVFPMLHAGEDVYEYLVDYFNRPEVVLPTGLKLGLRAGGVAKKLTATMIASRVRAMAGNFIAGADPHSALPVLERLRRDGMAFSVDLLGEACVSHEEAAIYQRRYLELIDTIAAGVATWPDDAKLDEDHLGRIPRANVSIKLSALAPRLDPLDFDGSAAALVAALRPILLAAQRRGVLVNFDMEQTALKELTLAVFMRCCEEIDFAAGLALQAYLRSGEDDARRLIDWAQRVGRPITVRLIKGAYWDYEVARAEQLGWPVPVWTNKRETDACFERMAALFVEHMPRQTGEPGVKLAIGTHNIRSIAWTLAVAQQHGLPPRAVEVQTLFGMADNLKAALVDRGLRVRQYVPIGAMVPGMAYLIRRLLENTSNQSWLRAGFVDDVPARELLASPHDEPGTDGRPPELPAVRHALSAAVPGLGNGLPFFNEPLRDFSQSDQRVNFARAVSLTQLGDAPREATAAEADAALARAHAAFPAWRDAPPLARAQKLVAAAELLRSDRDAIAALMIREAGKTWREADADVCEAIDFCEFYARASVALFEPRPLGRLPGEWNATWHQARGVAAVISPWNFPLAICAGMTTAALVTGNTVLVKPSSQTRRIAERLCQALWGAGVPRDVLHFVPGSGREVGERLVTDPRVAIIAFTGSKDVGLRILRLASETGPGQGQVKHVVCEMGGKNAIIVDNSADLDEAVLGVRQSAFGYSGQKCSACSRVIVLAGVYDLFLHRLVESTRALVIGDPAEPGTDIGPVIDEAAARKIREYIEIGKAEAKLELSMEVPAGLDERVGKPYIGPHIFSDVTTNDRIANEEIFGPVLAVMRARSFDEALAIANATDYKLTGGVFSRKPSHLERARREFRVGNLYLNRGITGALVGRQPFGGFGLSGGGTKAGGADYLLHFVDPRSICENTMRHGFTPEL